MKTANETLNYVTIVVNMLRNFTKTQIHLRQVSVIFLKCWHAFGSIKVYSIPGQKKRQSEYYNIYCCNYFTLNAKCNLNAMRMHHLVVPSQKHTPGPEF